MYSAQVSKVKEILETCLSLNNGKVWCNEKQLLEKDGVCDFFVIKKSDDEYRKRYPQIQRKQKCHINCQAEVGGVILSIFSHIPLKEQNIFRLSIV